MMLNLNLNDRERERYAKQFRSIAKEASALADKIVEGKESEIMVGFLIFSLCMSNANEFQEIVVAAAEKAKDEVVPEFPSIIEG